MGQGQEAYSREFRAYGKYARNLPAKVRLRRSWRCGARSVKPSAQPTLVRTQHLPPRKTPRSGPLRVVAAGRLASFGTVSQCRRRGLGLCMVRGLAVRCAVPESGWRARRGVLAEVSRPRLCPLDRSKTRRSSTRREQALRQRTGKHTQVIQFHSALKATGSKLPGLRYPSAFPSCQHGSVRIGDRSCWPPRWLCAQRRNVPGAAGTGKPPGPAKTAASRTGKNYAAAQSAAPPPEDLKTRIPAGGPLGRWHVFRPG
jgi:hypothetical protein